MKSKAVLEFDYPEDEDKLRHALNGEDYFNALVGLHKFISESKAPKLREIKSMLDTILEK